MSEQTEKDFKDTKKIRDLQLTRSLLSKDDKVGCS